MWLACRDAEMEKALHLLGDVYLKQLPSSKRYTALLASARGCHKYTGGGGVCELFGGCKATEVNKRITGQSDRNYRANSLKVWWGKLRD